MPNDQSGADQDGADQEGADRSGTTPPRGWQLPREDERRDETDPLAQILEELLALVPDDLRARLTAAVRQLLEAIRALIDWCVARLEHRESGDVEVHDIPIL
jgi:hypothetical protein